MDHSPDGESVRPEIKTAGTAEAKVMRRRPFGPTRAGQRARRKPYHLSVEVMESRQLLATFVVNTTADGGLGSLRQAIIDANTTPGNDLISFTIPGAGVGVERNGGR